MEKWRSVDFSKEEEEGITAEIEEVCEGEIFQRTLAGRLWTDNSFNSKAFISTMLGAWKLKNAVEVQELNKNLFLFRFTTRREMENILKNGQWSFDRNLLVLSRITGEEQPSELNMHFGTFWVRVYELPLMLRSEAMAKKLGGILGDFEELDTKEAHRNGRFLRIKVNIDLRKPLKRGTMVRFKEKNLRVHFKYERLPTFCFVCGKLGHQIKDCDVVGDLSEEGFENIEEQDLAFGAWLRASPLPRIQEEVKKKDTSSSSCSKNLFNVSSGQSRHETKGKSKDGEEGEVEQQRTMVQDEPGAKIATTKKNTQEIQLMESNRVQKGKEPRKTNLEIEAMAESLGAVDISNVGKGSKELSVEGKSKKRKWIRRQNTRKATSSKTVEKEVERGKRNLVDVMIIDGTVDTCGKGEKKLKGQEEEVTTEQGPEVVLDNQHRLPQ
ncbi:uncharacterized protein LOC131604465 [Vicia villosa]|uniref:uncharacterized protein LOC131604465 n=1 Tax=Vicia villosa TaxID=3911 RepID=UPI00273ABBE8|nr:uncharacterized protein LOC131604465 [Vicia villosa]